MVVKTEKQHVYTKEELDWAKSLIKPDLPEYDDKDHEIAKLRFVLSEIFEELSGVIYLTGPHGKDYSSHAPKTIAGVNELLKNIVWRSDGEYRIPDGTEQKDVDNYAEIRGWKSYQHAHLEEHHCGDCTAVAASCTKCHAEKFYGFNTQYEGKHKGWKALNIYINHFLKELGEPT